MTESPILGGVLPVLPTPFAPVASPTPVGLAPLVRYLLRCGVDGMTYPGVASEFDTLSEEERAELTAIVAAEAQGRCAGGRRLRAGHQQQRGRDIRLARLAASSVRPR